MKIKLQPWSDLYAGHPIDAVKEDPYTLYKGGLNKPYLQSQKRHSRSWKEPYRKSDYAVKEGLNTTLYSQLKEASIRCIKED